ncbi:MAG TPA: hypothetical protein ENI98_01035 [Gammaproteobacteria bacterium]|nr:hypothetical protein [Gammaproteobacteria bacterium]
MQSILQGSIVELENSPAPATFQGGVFVSSLHKLYEMKLKSLREIYDFKADVPYQFLMGGLWMKIEEGESFREHFIDIFHKGIVHPDLKVNLETGAMLIGDNRIIAFDGNAEEQYLYIFNLDSNALRKVAGRYRYFTSDGKYVFVRNHLKLRLVCFDLDLKERWDFSLEGTDYGRWTKTPQLFEDLVLVNHAFNVIAFRKQDGQEVWRYKFDSSCGPTCCNLIGDKLYAECFGTGYVINPRNGEVIHEVPLGFPSGEQKQCVNTYFYPFQDKLVALSGHDGSVRVFSDDGATLLQELHCPREYKISSNTPPVITDDAIYQSVSSRMAFAGGVLVLSISDNESDNVIEIQSRPEIHIIKQGERDGKHAYNLYVDATDADTINRFGQISIKEIHFETGSEVYSDDLEYDGRDKQHNGQINFFVDPAQLNESEKKRLKSDIRELEAYFKEPNRTAGDGTSAIKIEVLFKPKSEWDLSGEPVDLKQLRETRWANDPDEVGYS